MEIVALILLWVALAAMGLAILKFRKRAKPEQDITKSHRRLRVR